jgi:hypothetical protein
MPFSRLFVFFAPSSRHSTITRFITELVSHTIPSLVVSQDNDIICEGSGLSGARYSPLACCFIDCCVKQKAVRWAISWREKPLILTLWR